MYSIPLCLYVSLQQNIPGLMQDRDTQEKPGLVLAFERRSLEWRSQTCKGKIIYHRAVWGGGKPGGLEALTEGVAAESDRV